MWIFLVLSNLGLLCFSRVILLHVGECFFEDRTRVGVIGFFRDLMTLAHNLYILALMRLREQQQRRDRTEDSNHLQKRVLLVIGHEDMIS